MQHEAHFDQPEAQSEDPERITVIHDYKPHYFV